MKLDLLLPAPPRDEPDISARAGRAQLRTAIAQLDDIPPAALVALADELEEAGMVAEAIRAVRRLLELAPTDADAWSRLAALHDEHADAPRAARCRARARALGAEVRGPGAIDPGDASSPEFSGADLERFVALFSGREDHHARQWAAPRTGRGGYSPVDGSSRTAARRDGTCGCSSNGLSPPTSRAGSGRPSCARTVPQTSAFTSRSSRSRTASTARGSATS